ncbi:hypothetical protein BABINDRAFT_162624 [Babjeviella inositovora NRRL Y-12698]|uniref:low-specificity L-threonine aldolase n=1 Tax=Babjeviella inositovora NRRL Y-12698 TaxID=984486 RepID=A0A1E3QN21_9ASCO|nr:uncharacterized protein BABINDRAFT_162624 [Babjeviella inositovora NRRL Y-12698]ODQ78387.1 hypothetical protein BABINDRAFT_162624 [Babjeviella inositovora NRRL Y-12698]
MPGALSPVHNEFRSDTFTQPTASVLAAATTCTLGDSVYQEDASTIALEQKLAVLTGKPAGLFCVSGTLSNQLALRTHLYQPPHSILCDYRAHVYSLEAGGVASLSQAMVTPVHPANGDYLTLEDIVENFIPDDGDIHLAPTKVISLEQTLHGIVTPIEELRRISAWCKDQQVILHCDGARLWNAHIATGISMAEYCSLFDSVSLCLSKSLGAPIGSVLVGEAAFIKKANHFKKQNGGGIRQAGIIAAMASVAIDENLPQLHRSHAMARELGEYCESLGVVLESPVHTNFVFIDTKKSKMNGQLLSQLATKYDVKIGGSRIAFHFQNSNEALQNVKKAVKECYEDSLVNPYIATGISKFYNIK